MGKNTFSFTENSYDLKDYGQYLDAILNPMDKEELERLASILRTAVREYDSLSVMQKSRELMTAYARFIGDFVFAYDRSAQARENLDRISRMHPELDILRR